LAPSAAVVAMQQIATTAIAELAMTDRGRADMRRTSDTSMRCLPRL
jgi:hypothetical protein